MKQNIIFGTYFTDRDPAVEFLNPANQKLLKSLTRLRLEKVYRKRVVLNNKVEYKFMTTEEIEAEIKTAFRKAEAMLQMPPVVKVRFWWHYICKFKCFKCLLNRIDCRGGTQNHHH